MSFVTRVAMGYLGTLALVGCIAFFGYQQFRTLADATAKVSYNSLPEIELLGRIKSEITEFRVGKFDHVASTDPEQWMRIEQDMDIRRAAVEADSAAYEQAGLSPDEVRLFAAFRESWNTYVAEYDSVFLPLSRSNDDTAAAAYVHGRGAQ